MEIAGQRIIEHEEYQQQVILREFQKNQPVCSHWQQHDVLFQRLWFQLDVNLTANLRVKTVLVLAELGISVYGNPEWKEGLKNSQVSYSPNVDYDSVLPSLYGTAKIVVNRTPLNLQNAIQQRCLDVGAVGGFILTDYRPILEEHFELDQEIVVYHNIDDLKEKTKYYLDHEPERQRIAQNLQNKVLSEHTWDDRVSEYIHCIRKISSSKVQTQIH